MALNFEATLRLRMPDLAYCTAFLVNDQIALTNHHCCPSPDDCVGEQFALQARYRGTDTSGADLFEESFAVVAQRMNVPELDAVALLLDRSASAYGHVVFARGRGFVGSAVYVTGHPRGRPLESSLGIIYGYEESITYHYADEDKAKIRQLIYGARAEPGSSGSPVFLVGTNALVGIHHTGGLESEQVGLSSSDTDGFNRLLGATDSEALAQALEMHGIEFAELETD